VILLNVSKLYSSNFMAYTAAGSRTSAEFIAPLLCRTLPIKSILDVGCAVGTWLHAWQQSGIADVHGVDGGYVDRSQLQVPPDCFTSADLSQEIVLGRKFDYFGVEDTWHLTIFGRELRETVPWHSGIVTT
jgi:hypothetical protein